MAVAIVMPKLGMVMSEGTVNKWTKNTGDYVTSGTVLAEIETEKAAKKEDLVDKPAEENQ